MASRPRLATLRQWSVDPAGAVGACLLAIDGVPGAVQLDLVGVRANAPRGRAQLVVIKTVTERSAEQGEPSLLRCCISPDPTGLRCARPRRSTPDRDRDMVTDPACEL
jgi:hypothetical protein